MRQKFKAFVISAFWTVLPCILAGGIVGAFFVAAFWYWVIGIATISLPWVLMNRVHVRLYNGSLQGKTLIVNLQYGYASTEYYPRHPLFASGWWSWYWGFFRRHF